MQRTTLIPHAAALLAVALVLGGCSNDAGSATKTAAVEGGKPSPSATAEGGNLAPFVCTAQTGVSGTSTITVPEPGVPDGGLRESILHIPASYDGTKPTMLVLNFHGLLETNTLQQSISHMSDTSDARGFIVAYPQGLKVGLGVSWNAGACCANSTDDMGFVRDLVKLLESKYCIDPKRVFATGLSNGAMLSYRLACEASDMFAAVAPVAGAVQVQPCEPPRPVPILAFHGTNDTVVPFNGGKDGIVHVLKFPPVAYSIDLWKHIDGCTDSPAPDDASTMQMPADSTPDGGPNASLFAGSTVVSQKGDATCHAWTGCKGGTEVELCTIVNGGHNWPGGSLTLGHVSTDIDASNVIIDFFDKHPMP